MNHYTTLHYRCNSICFKLLIPILAICSLSIFPASLIAQTHCYSEEGTPSITNSGLVNCGNRDNYIPTATTPIKTVKLMFHIMQREEPFPKDNFDENNPAHVAYLNGLVDRLNSLFSNCNVMWCNCDWQSTGYNRDSRIRFELQDIKYWRSNAGYNNQSGLYSDTYCLNNFGICKDEILNIFFCQISGTVGGYGPPSHVMMFNQYSEYLDGVTDTWGPGNLLGHECGHTFGLPHSFCGRYSDMCQSEYTDCISRFCQSRETDCQCSNNMMSGARLSDFISPMQMGQMHMTLLNSSVSKYLKPSFEPNLETEITGAVEWETARLADRSIRIKPGGSLTIKCNLLMPENAQIIVERGARLIIDGGKISTKGVARTSCSNNIPKFERWQGVQVWGNTNVTATQGMLNETYQLLSSDPGIVIMKNGAIIENAQIGIYGQQRGTPWTSQLEHFGGLISVDDGMFTNCRKAVEYISHTPKTVTSTFQNCTIRQTYLSTSLTNQVSDFEGVTAWQTNGMIFKENCKFLNLEKGVVLGNSTATIVKSTFEFNKYGVLLNMPAPTPDKKTFIGGPNEGNLFRYCNFSVLAQSYGLLVVNYNVFQDCYTGVVAEGTSIFNIKENEFKYSSTNNSPNFVTGVGAIQTGETGASYVQCNEYIVPNGSIAPIRDGISLFGNNSGFYWLDNKFACKYDVKIQSAVDNSGNIVDNGIVPDQGGNFNGVFNLYSPLSSVHKADILTSAPATGTTQLFNYYVPTDDCTSRLVPRCPSAGECAGLPQCAGIAYGFTNIAFPSLAPECSFGVINGYLGSGDCRTKECLDQYYTALNDLDAAYTIVADPTIIRQKTTVNNKKMALLRHLTDSLYQIGQVEKAAVLWQADPERFSREALVGLRLETRNFAAVGDLLNNYPTTSNDDIRYKAIQTIHLNSQVQPNYAFSAADSSALYDIALGGSEQAGYAKSLITVLTGKVIPPVLPDDKPNIERGDLRTSDFQIPLFDLRPNPANNTIYIHLNAEVYVGSQLLIRDIYGRTLLATVITGAEHPLDISALPHGQYAATLITSDGTLYTKILLRNK